MSIASRISLRPHVPVQPHNTSLGVLLRGADAEVIASTYTSASSSMMSWGGAPPASMAGAPPSAMAGAPPAIHATTPQQQQPQQQVSVPAAAAGLSQQHPAAAAAAAAVAAAPSSPLPEGWRQVESRSRPGQFSYENENTGERVAWRPTEPAQLLPTQVKTKLEGKLLKQSEAQGRQRRVMAAALGRLESRIENFGTRGLWLQVECMALVNRVLDSDPRVEQEGDGDTDVQPASGDTPTAKALRAHFGAAQADLAGVQAQRRVCLEADVAALQGKMDSGAGAEELSRLYTSLTARAMETRLPEMTTPHRLRVFVVRVGDELPGTFDDPLRAPAVADVAGIATALLDRQQAQHVALLAGVGQLEAKYDRLMAAAGGDGGAGSGGEEGISGGVMAALSEDYTSLLTRAIDLDPALLSLRGAHGLARGIPLELDRKLMHLVERLMALHREEREVFASGLRAIARYVKSLALHGVQQIKGPMARIEDAAWPLDTPAAWASLCASLRASTMQHDGTSSRAVGDMSVTMHPTGDSGSRRQVRGIGRNWKETRES